MHCPLGNNSRATPGKSTNPRPRIFSKHLCAANMYDLPFLNNRKHPFQSVMCNHGSYRNSSTSNNYVQRYWSRNAPRKVFINLLYHTFSADVSIVARVATWSAISPLSDPMTRTTGLPPGMLLFQNTENQIRLFLNTRGNARLK